MSEQTVKQIADKLRECVVFFEGDDCAGGLICRAAVAELERLGKADYEFQSKLADGIADAFLSRRWIPVGERLPEDDQQCLTVDKDGVQRVARFDAIGDGERHSWYEEQEWKSVYPVAWMPLPEPPEVK
jgi:hypothetical protein